jgi:hypothetical protein
VKYVVISRLAPGVDNAQAALATFMKVGVGPGTEATYAVADGKTFINIVEQDTPDVTVASSYAPFFESTVIYPVVPVDATWLEAIEAARANWE